MEILDREQTSKGTPDRFIGDVWVDRLAGTQPGEHIRVNVVRFAPGARNAWHAHALGQTLYVTDGVGRVQAADHEFRRFAPVTRSTRGQGSGIGTAPRPTIS